MGPTSWRGGSTSTSSPRQEWISFSTWGELPFSNVALIFAEHFVEHLDFHDGLCFLTECRRALIDAGVLRLSTPNLDWVWRNQYHYGAWQGDDEAIRDCFWMNKAFHGWGHRFLYNRQALTEVLREAGFAEVELASYGESRRPELRNLERHEQYVDTPDLPHVIIVEASGRRQGFSQALRDPRADFQQAIAIRPPETPSRVRRPRRWPWLWRAEDR